MKIGVDLGGSHIGVGLINNENKLIAMAEKDLEEKDKQEIEEFLKLKIKEMIEGLLKVENIKKEEIELIGLAVPGRVNNNGEISAVNLNLEDYPIKSILKKDFSCNIQIRNDAKCSGICEKQFGSLKKYKDAVFLCLGTGIGSSVFLKNKLLTSSHSEAFELGHFVIEKDGIQCNCGKKGCFEKYAAMSVFKKNIQNVLNLPQNISGEDILNIIKKEKNNEKVKEVIDNYINNLSLGIVNIIEIFDPEAICLGGSFVHFEDILLDRLKKQIEKAPSINKNKPEIILAQMGNNAGIIGAVL